MRLKLENQEYKIDVRNILLLKLTLLLSGPQNTRMARIGSEIQMIGQ